MVHGNFPKYHANFKKVQTLSDNHFLVQNAVLEETKEVIQYCTVSHPYCCDLIFSGRDDPQEYDQACLRRCLSCSDCLRLWAPHE